MAQLRAVIFDLGHTIWDYAPREDSRRLNVLRLHDRLASSLKGTVPPPATLDRALADGIGRWLKAWDGDNLEQPPSEELVRDALGALDITLQEELLRELTAIFFGTEVDMPVVEPDTLAAVARLNESGLLMGCVTNTILLDEGIHDALRRLGLLRYFRSVVVSSAMSYRKPHESLFLRALQDLDVAPEEALFVGDRLVDDVSGAQSVGMRAFLTHQYRQEPVEDSQVKPDDVLRRLGHLPQALERLEARP